MYQLRHNYCIFSDEFTVMRTRQIGYCIFCGLPGTELLQVDNVVTLYPEHIEALNSGIKLKALARDGRYHRVYVHSHRNQSFPIKCNVRIGGLSISGYVFYSQVDSILKFRANPTTANAHILPEPEFGYELLERKNQNGIMISEWKMHPYYQEKLDAAVVPKLRSELTELEYLASNPEDVVDDLTSIEEPNELNKVDGDEVDEEAESLEDAPY